MSGYFKNRMLDKWSFEALPLRPCVLSVLDHPLKYNNIKGVRPTTPGPQNVHSFPLSSCIM